MLAKAHLKKGTINNFTVTYQILNGKYTAYH